MTAVYAKLHGGELGWLRLLACGWQFTSWIVEPMQGHHGAWSVIMIDER